MQFFIKTVESISEYSGRLVSWVLYAGIFMLTFEVVARYFFNSPTVWAHGYTQRLFGSFFILIGAYTFIHDGHVRIDLISQKCSPKVQTILDIVNCVFLVVWSAVLIPAGWKFFVRSYTIGEVDEMVLAHPIWWVKGLLVVGMILIFLQGVSELIKKIMSLFNPTEETT
jgi:TRAP-type mannitol/chloroaromatic compound transport system permease small subunit